MVEGGRLLHKGPDKIVGDSVHDDFLTHHVDGLAAEHVHAKGDLDVPEEQLDGPATEVEIGKR